MKRTLHIAKNELNSMFFSPVAWLMMVLFLILTSVDYLRVTSDFVGYFERGGYYLMLTKDLTDGLLSHPLFGYFFHDVIPNLYIFFPLITMGLISKEISSGTIKLLYSSPIRISEMVFGKFLAMVCFTLVLILMLSFTLIGLSFSLAHPDYGHIFASVLGLFLVLCTYAAIGLFISSLTSYQIVAAIITFAVLAFLSKIGNLWQDIDSLRNITYYMNINGKSFDLIRGLLNTRDIFYFLIVITSFLFFTIIRIKSATESISKLKKISRYAVVIVAAFTIGYITSRPRLNMYYDTTRDKTHTITPPTRAMLAKLDDGPLEINVFWNLLDFSYDRMPPKDRNGIETFLWEPYIRFKPNIKINYYYYYDADTGSYYFKLNPGKTLREIAEKQAKGAGLSLSRFLSPEQVNKMVNTKKQEYRCFFQLKYKNKSAILNVFDDNDFWPYEDQIAASINRLIATPPKIEFLTDEIERGPFSERTRDFKLIASYLGNRYALINEGYDFDTLSLKDKAAIPLNIAALVIADPRTPFSSENMAKIKSYIDAGGNLFVASEPERRDVIKPLFDELGLSIRSGQLIQPSEKYSSDCIFTYLSDRAKNLSPQFHKFLADEQKYAGDSVFRVALGGASVMEYKEQNGFHIEPLLRTDPNLSWNRMAPISEDSLQLKVGRLPSDEHGQFVTAVLMDRQTNGKDQRIVAASDANYLTKTVIYGGWDPKRYNYDFGFWCFSYFSYGKFPTNTLRPQTDDKMSITVADLPKQRILLFYILPALIAIAGSVILIRRKRK